MSLIKPFGGWYNLPKEIQNRVPKCIHELRDHGRWATRKELKQYEPDAVLIMRTSGTLTCDFIMPRLAKAAAEGWRVAVFPVGMGWLDVVFYPKDDAQKDTTQYIKVVLPLTAKEKQEKVLALIQSRPMADSELCEIQLHAKHNWNITPDETENVIIPELLKAGMIYEACPGVYKIVQQDHPDTEG